MSRGDPEYCRVDIDIVFGEKFQQLTSEEQHTYLLGPWMLAVKYRFERLPAYIQCTRLTVARLSKSKRTVARHMQRMHDIGLIILHENKDVTVCGVMKSHARLHWKDYDDYVPLPGHYPDTSLPVGAVDREYESTRVREPNISILNLNPEGGAIVDNPGLSADAGQDKKPDKKPGKIRLPQVTDPIIVQDESWMICNGLGIEDTDANMNTLADMFSRYSGADVKQAYLDTKDKQESDKCGTSAVPMQKPPLAYMWGCLRKERV